ncbi:MAG TPA: restriction endonuclease [Tahibacter sp.]|nr:restriction endonuclease [Tahibacter sp.]
MNYGQRCVVAIAPPFGAAYNDAMAIPTYDKFIEPLLRFLASRLDGAPTREATEAVANALAITEEERQELVPSGTQPIYKNRAGWAHDRLKRAQLSSSPRRGHWQLTAQGRQYAASNPPPLAPDQIEHLAVGYIDVRLSGLNETSLVLDSIAESPALSVAASPDDRLGQAVSEIRQSVVVELLELLGRVTPSYFETIVLDLLHRMGYGTSRADLQRIGGSGDGGIDGIISLDKLGLEKIYVQAKRWQGTVGRPEVQAFYGALAGQRANKGVFITTSGYTAQAIEFAKSVEKIVLIDGARLSQLMIDHEIGVYARVIKVPKIDSDYFDEDTT